MGDWYKATFGAEKDVVGPTSPMQRAKTLSDKPALIYKMFRDPAVGVFQDELIRLNQGPKARALALKIEADNTDHGDFGPATSAALVEFQQKAGLPVNGRSVSKAVWDAMAIVKSVPGAINPMLSEAGLASGWSTFWKVGIAVGLGWGGLKALKGRK